MDSIEKTLNEQKKANEKTLQENAELKRKCQEGQASNSELRQQVQTLEKTWNEQKKANATLVEEKTRLEEKLRDLQKKSEVKGEWFCDFSLRCFHCLLLCSRSSSSS